MNKYSSIVSQRGWLASNVTKIFFCFDFLFNNISISVYKKKNIHIVVKDNVLSSVKSLNNQTP